MTFYSDFVAHYDHIFPFRETTFRFLQDHIGSPSAAVLDIGCGTGAYVARFAEAGHPAVGIDLNADMIDFARAHHPDGEFHCLDMRETGALTRQFDLIYSIGNVVSHLPPTDLDDVLMAVRDRLISGGKWIFQTVNWDFVGQQASFDFPLIEYKPAGLRFGRSYTELRPERVHFNTRLYRHDTLIFDDTSVLYPWQSDAVLAAHMQAGFRLVGHYANFQYASFSTDRPGGSVFVFEDCR